MTVHEAFLVAAARDDTHAPAASIRQLLQFCAVGSSGYAVNLSVYGALLAGGANLRVAACAAFLVAVANNYTWNRLWTFRRQRAGVASQGARFLTVSLVALVANLLVLSGLVRWGVPSMAAQAMAIVIVIPVNFLGNKLWSFRSLS